MCRPITLKKTRDITGCMSPDINLIAAIGVTAVIGIAVAVVVAKEARRRGIEAGKSEIALRYRREQQAAVHLFVSRLTSLVTRPCEDDAAALRARSIVGVVDSFQNTIASITAPIAPEMQQLKHQLELLSDAPNDARAREALMQLLATLRAGWPEKKHAVENIVQQLLAQLSTTDATAAREP